jgi:hypothetical protein
MANEQTNLNHEGHEEHGGSGTFHASLICLCDLCDLKAWPLLRIHCSCDKKLMDEKVRDSEDVIASTRDARALPNRQPKRARF